MRTFNVMTQNEMEKLNGGALLGVGRNLTFILKRMLDMEQACLENIYTADMFFKDLFSMLFCDFKADSEVSFSRMDMQVVCVNTLLASGADASVPVVKWKLQELGERLKALAGQHEAGAVRKVYAMLSSRIEKVLNK